MSSEPPSRTPGRTAVDELIRWIRDNAHPLATLGPDTPLDALQPLGDLVGEAKVIGLGGSTRGAHELSALTTRFFRYLVEDHGFRALAVEDDWTKGIELDEYVRTGRGNPRALLADAWPPNRTDEMLDVLRWMRSYNEQHPGDQVRFVGVDVTSVRSIAYDAVTDHVAAVAPGRLPELEAHYETLRPTVGIAEHVERYRNQPSKQPFIDHARQAYDLVRSLPAGDGHAFAVQHARVIVSFHEYNATDSLPYAEQCLAENTIWWHEHTGDKIVRSGGFGHSANAPTRSFSPPSIPRPERNAGSILREHFGPAYLSVALMFDHGTVLSPTPGPVPSPPPAFADGALGAAGLDHPTYLLDLHAERPPAVREWLDAAAKVRLIGPSFDADDNAAYHLSGGSLAEWFDIIVHSQTATPSHPLTEDDQRPVGIG